MVKEKIVESILVESIGYIYSDDDPIENYTVNGEMALVDWYRKGNQEWNGRYVIQITYKDEK